jgi:hypothetical protein
LAQIYPGIDQNIEERARDLTRWSEQGFGRWGYARAIDDWWIEGTRACVIVRGVEHCMPDDGDPAENQETVWTFALRKQGDDWTIGTLSQGWPRFGSAKALSDSDKPWLKRWSSGDVL